MGRPPTIRPRPPDAVTVDVADETSVAEVVAVTAERFGGGGVLVNNAGLPMGRYNLTSTLSLQEWRRLFDADLFGAVRSRPGARHGRARRRPGTPWCPDTPRSVIGIYNINATSGAALGMRACQRGLDHER